MRCESCARMPPSSTPSARRCGSEDCSHGPVVSCQQHRAAREDAAILGVKRQKRCTFPVNTARLRQTFGETNCWYPVAIVQGHSRAFVLIRVTILTPCATIVPKPTGAEGGQVGAAGAAARRLRDAGAAGVGHEVRRAGRHVEEAQGAVAARGAGRCHCARQLPVRRLSAAPFTDCKRRSSVILQEVILRTGSRSGGEICKPLGKSEPHGTNSLQFPNYIMHGELHEHSIFKVAFDLCSPAASLQSGPTRRRLVSSEGRNSQEACACLVHERAR